VNFEENGDEGEIWFGEESVEKMVDWTLEHVPPPISDEQPGPRILELGSGNGTLLFALLEAGYAASLSRSTDPNSNATVLCGIDYSPAAVTLAKSIAAQRGESAENIVFCACDFLHEAVPSPSHMDAKWDLVLDKGTYDAIALAEKDESGVLPIAGYPPRLARLLKPGGLFLITSCNFTEDELEKRLATPETGLVVHSRIKHRTFTFGGATGNVVSSVAFVKQ